ncbi:MAG: long-chain fatty acid--CoA ligase [Myxococcales bacterium]|nr:long-chain fatty acid--CoA ligase [Myxococcales bacterium]
MVRTVSELLDERVAKTPSATCYEQKARGASERVSWAEFTRRADALSLALREAGLGPGDCVAVMGQTTGEWAVSDLGVLGAGGVSVGVYSSLTARQVAHILGDCKAKMAFVGSRAELSVVREAAELAGGLLLLVGWGEVEAEPGVKPLSELLRRGAELAASSPDRIGELRRMRSATDLALVIYTSGTTGLPKGAMLSHGNCVAMVKTAEEIVPKDIGSDDVTVSFLPMAHVAEHVIGLYGRINTGMATRYVGSLESQVVLAAVQETKPTVFGSVPRIFEKAYAQIRARVAAANPSRQAIFRWAERTGKQMSRHRRGGTPAPVGLRLQHAIADRMVFAKIRGAFGGRVKYFISGAAPIDVEILEFFEACGMRVLEVYGLTECCGIATANRSAAPRFGTVGRPLPGVEVRLAEDGEVLVRGPTVFMGYLNRPDATRDALDAEGWLHTGDIGVLEDGHVKITDRKRNLIVTAGGKKVAPAAIEALLSGETLLGPALIVGEGKPYISALLTLDLEEARAATGLRQGSPKELAHHPTVRERALAAVERANQELAKYERIRRFRILDRELTIAGEELTPTMKLRRKAVTEKFKDEVDSLYSNGAGPELFDLGKGEALQ